MHVGPVNPDFTHHHALDASIDVKFVIISFNFSGDLGDKTESKFSRLNKCKVSSFFIRIYFKSTLFYYFS